MPLILPVKDKNPVIGNDCFIADNATIVGDVIIGNNCSLWFNAVVRGDVNSITIGNHTNIQDGVVVHCTYLKAATVIGHHVSVGHNAIIHGCTLHNYILVGMGAIIMDNTIVEDYCIIAAGAVVLENTKCESGFIYAGTPANKVKAVSEAQMQLLKQLPLNYNLYSSWFTGL
jgi:carbonic anhydrase/acetyltransferase-like protein (isoleucine patch superfamily)